MDLGAVFPTQIGTDPVVIRDFAQTAEGARPGTWNASTSSMTDHCATYRASSCAGSSNCPCRCVAAVPMPDSRTIGQCPPR